MFFKRKYFRYKQVKKQTLSYIDTMKVGKNVGVYKYSNSTTKPNIYSSVYACMILSLYNELQNLSQIEREESIDYLNSFQCKKDGLFYDPVIKNELFDNSDWWGARHLVLHIIIALTALKAKPKYKFKFLERYYKKIFLLKWLNSKDWNSVFNHNDDFDNKIMNIGSLLQYSRDSFNDEKAGKAVKWLISFLKNKINSKTGMWGDYDLDKPENISRMVQFAYHLFSIFFYDNYDLQNKEKIIDFVLKTQNKRGGYGTKLNSSACEDIDSINILIYLAKQTDYKKKEIKLSLKKVLPWILSNMNKDGGFVFRRNEAFVYGHKEMSSKKNESAMFPTWFRTLSLAYLSKVVDDPSLKKINWNFVNCPGYQFWKN